VAVLNKSLSTSRLKEVPLLATQSVVVTQPESGLFTPTAVAGKLIIRSDIIAPQSELCNTASEHRILCSFFYIHSSNFRC
jgi:hypothetical protein